MDSEAAMATDRLNELLKTNKHPAETVYTFEIV
jgi:hypothetical protein